MGLPRPCRAASKRCTTTGLRLRKIADDDCSHSALFNHWREGIGSSVSSMCTRATENVEVPIDAGVPFLREQLLRAGTSAERSSTNRALEHACSIAALALASWLPAGASANHNSTRLEPLLREALKEPTLLKTNSIERCSLPRWSRS